MSEDPGPRSAQHQVAAEQALVDVMYARLDELRQTLDSRLRRLRVAGPSGTPQNRSERDAFAVEYERRLAQLWSVEERLAFGRLDLQDGGTRYVGRLGLFDDEQRQLLVDWRADAAQDFYRATAVSPGEVVRRRHLAMRGRHVVGVEDEVFDLDRVAGPEAQESLVLSGEGALMAALAEHRTGHMRDIVSTIQAEQDRIVRAPIDGVLVVQGGPGTGKTAVALHRAAYLLYQHRDRLAQSGVLVIGPNPTFLHYIEQVLPSLGETAAVLTTLDELVPGVDVTAEEDSELVRLKGDARMAEVIDRAVRSLQRVPARPVSLVVDGVSVSLDPRVVRRARERARHSGRPHNAARAQFVHQVLEDLAQQLAAAQGVTYDRDYRTDLLDELRDSPDVRREVNLCWMPTTPQRLLTRLFSRAELLEQSSPMLSPSERERLLRAADAGWTTSDVPLLDEAAHLLGDDEGARRLEEQRAAAERAAAVEYARSVIGSTGAGGGLVSAEALADRFADRGPELTVAERALSDRSWTYGHVVVDEAQELSAMAWRAVARRCPNRSMTVVGDTAQTSSAAGTGDWNVVVEQFAPGQWRLEQLTVNYRTPAQIMSVADRLLAADGRLVTQQVAAREGLPPVLISAPLIDREVLEHVVAAELESLGGGRLAVVFPRRGYDELAELLHREATGQPRPELSRMLDEPLVTLTAAQVKGLEFDSVVVVEPLEMVEQADRGVGDLYVAMTRPTQRLTVIHSRPLPTALAEMHLWQHSTR